jgi:hypothetical protein
MITHFGADPVNERCRQWMERLLAGGIAVRVPEIADYELRRNLVRIRSERSLTALDSLVARIGYVALTTVSMRKAASYWAQARWRGKAATDNKRLDGDMILCGQVSVLVDGGDDAEIATDNTRHFSHFFKAREWFKIHV